MELIIVLILTDQGTYHCYNTQHFSDINGKMNHLPDKKKKISQKFVLIHCFSKLYLIYQMEIVQSRRYSSDDSIIFFNETPFIPEFPYYVIQNLNFKSIK